MGGSGRLGSGGNRRENQVVVLAQRFYEGMHWSSSEALEAGAIPAGGASGILRVVVRTPLLKTTDMIALFL